MHSIRTRWRVEQSEQEDRQGRCDISLRRRRYADAVEVPWRADSWIESWWAEWGFYGQNENDDGKGRPWRYVGNSARHQPSCEVKTRPHHPQLHRNERIAIMFSDIAFSIARLKSLPPPRIPVLRHCSTPSPYHSSFYPPLSIAGARSLKSIGGNRSYKTVALGCTTNHGRR